MTLVGWGGMMYMLHCKKCICSIIPLNEVGGEQGWLGDGVVHGCWNNYGMVIRWQYMWCYYSWVRILPYYALFQYQSISAECLLKQFKKCMNKVRNDQVNYLRLPFFFFELAWVPPPPDVLLPPPPPVLCSAPPDLPPPPPCRVFSFGINWQIVS